MVMLADALNALESVGVVVVHCLGIIWSGSSECKASEWALTNKVLSAKFAVCARKSQSLTDMHGVPTFVSFRFRLVRKCADWNWRALKELNPKFQVFHRN
jgi:hypothetical protein